MEADISFREGLYETESFPERELAALVAAKIYYHLQEYDESMVFALGEWRSSRTFRILSIHFNYALMSAMSCSEQYWTNDLMRHAGVYADVRM